MKILITGAKGQLGMDLMKHLPVEWELFGMDRESLDITDMNRIREVIYDVNPDVILHSAAYTAVDQAELDQDQAYLVNTYGTRNLAIASEEFGAKLCYISTDYVFDGQASIPYNEFDVANPRTVYGKSKLAGERLIESLTKHYFIVRTSWVYGWHGNNFVKTMFKLAETKDRLTVVHDQVGSPTYTVDLARFLGKLVATDRYGIYHATNSGVCSWYEFAQAIFEEAGISIRLDPCTTEEFPRPAPRPRYSVLGHQAIRCNGFDDLRHWRDALKNFIDDYIK
jgi:dTDP-4-dehydrorhamnose reductase